jgi:hypothetical protein
VRHAEDVRSNDAFEPVKGSAGLQPFKRTRPIGAAAQTHGIVVSVGVAKPQHQASRGVDPQRIDEFFAHQPHGDGTQDDDALLVQSDDAKVRPKIEHLRQMEMLRGAGLGMGRFFHV